MYASDLRLKRASGKSEGDSQRKDNEVQLHPIHYTYAHGAQKVFIEGKVDDGVMNTEPIHYNNDM